MLIIETSVLPKVKLKNVHKASHSGPGRDAKFNNDGLTSSSHLSVPDGLTFFSTFTFSSVLGLLNSKSQSRLCICNAC